jgi:hypothetical protein
MVTHLLIQQTDLILYTLYTKMLHYMEVEESTPIFHLFYSIYFNFTFIYYFIASGAIWYYQIKIIIKLMRESDYLGLQLY